VPKKNALRKLYLDSRHKSLVYEWDFIVTTIHVIIVNSYFFLYIILTSIVYYLNSCENQLFISISFCYIFFIAENYNGLEGASIPLYASFICTQVPTYNVFYIITTVPLPCLEMFKAN